MDKETILQAAERIQLLIRNTKDVRTKARLHKSFEQLEQQYEQLDRQGESQCLTQQSAQ